MHHCGTCRPRGEQLRALLVAHGSALIPHASRPEDVPQDIEVASSIPTDQLSSNSTGDHNGWEADTDALSWFDWLLDDGYAAGSNFGNANPDWTIYTNGSDQDAQALAGVF